MVLTDKERRKKYDETGVIDEASIENERAQVMEVVAQFAAQIIQTGQFDLNRQSFVEALRDAMRTKITEGEQAPEKYRILLQRFDVVLKRLKRKGKKGDGSLIGMLTSQRGSIEAAKQRDLAVTERFKKALEYLRDYDYEVDQARQPTYQSAFMSPFGSTTNRW